MKDTLKRDIIMGGELRSKYEGYFEKGMAINMNGDKYGNG